MEPQRIGVANMGAGFFFSCCCNCFFFFFPFSFSSQKGITRRSFVYAREYCLVRTAWKEYLIDHGSMRVTLLDLMSESEACASLIVKCKSCCNVLGFPISEQKGHLVRLFTPLTKLRCCRRGVDMSSKALEVFGGFFPC